MEKGIANRGKIKGLFKESIRIVVLTGAGISQESGIKTFRDEDGLWENHRIEDVATPEGFERDPDLVYEFYNERRRLLETVQPNAAHVALAALERAFGDRCFLVTQNVDDLHERAGSGRVCHMHGELYKARCLACERVVEWRGKMTADSACADCGGKIRPHVVWFGEMPFLMDEIHEQLFEATHFCAIGTSGIVYPAAGFVGTAKLSGATCVEINLKPTGGPFDQIYEGPATEAVSRWVEAMLR